LLGLAVFRLATDQRALVARRRIAFRRLRRGEGKFLASTSLKAPPVNSRGSAKRSVSSASVTLTLVHPAKASSQGRYRKIWGAAAMNGEPSEQD
jgi:hypothetical protein